MNIPTCQFPHHPKTGLKSKLRDFLSELVYHNSLSRFFSSKNAFITPLPFEGRGLASGIGVRKIEVPSAVTTNLVPGWMPSLLRKPAGMVIYPLLFTRTIMA
jgi:hypothetical protein